MSDGPHDIAVYDTDFGAGWVRFSGETLSATGLPGSPLPMGERMTGAAAAELARDLGEYWAGRGPLPVVDGLAAMAASTPLGRRIYSELLAVDRGTTISYARLAARAGRPGAARAVGAAMARNPFAPLIPCHRVVGSDGTLRGYGGGIEMKRYLLTMESGRG